MTKYTVLTAKDGENFQVLAEVEATGPRKAITLALDANGSEESLPGTFATVPSRSWEPVKVGAKVGLTFS